MKRETIIMDEYGKVTVPSDTANLWMSGVLQSCEVERCIKQPNGYGVDVYALPMVVALAFRIGTPNAERVRNALLERLCLRKEKQLLWTFIRGSAYEC